MGNWELGRYLQLDFFWGQSIPFVISEKPFESRLSWKLPSLGLISFDCTPNLPQTLSLDALLLFVKSLRHLQKLIIKSIIVQILSIISPYSLFPLLWRCLFKITLSFLPPVSCLIFALLCEASIPVSPCPRVYPFWREWNSPAPYPCLPRLL